MPASGKLIITNVRSKEDITVKNLPAIIDQLTQAGFKFPYIHRQHRFSVELIVHEGGYPNWDIERYPYHVLNTMTACHLIWADDCQVDDLHVRREKILTSPDTWIEVAFALL